jgi:hypothetical protein
MRTLVLCLAALTALPAPARGQTPPPLAEDVLDPAMAATTAGQRLLTLVQAVRGDLRETRYQWTTRVVRRRGSYRFDCSGMTTWFLGQVAPRALRAVRAARPTARAYYDTIVRAPVDRARAGWQRLAHVSQARPGDVFAFPRSPLSTSKVTGHVGFVIAAPVAVPGWPGAWAVRILDSTRLPHQHDTRLDDGVGGFGFGTMLFVTDDTGEVAAYGWFGTDSAGLLPTHVVFGRLAG